MSQAKLTRSQPHLLTRLVLGVIWLYQSLLSAALGPRCRFYPTCSHYAAQAIRCHGLARGILLAAIRVSRCHPFHPGGIDPVPGTDDEAAPTEDNH